MSDVWKCAGCGVEGFDTNRRCDCATTVVCRGKEGATKTGPSWAKMRIEALEKACKEWAEVSQSNYQRAKAAEEKLAVAVEALEDVNTFGDFGLQHVARPALAKIKGDKP